MVQAKMPNPQPMSRDQLSVYQSTCVVFGVVPCTSHCIAVVGAERLLWPSALERRGRFQDVLGGVGNEVFVRQTPGP